jgi:hypothetical protein
MLFQFDWSQRLGHQYIGGAAGKRILNLWCCWRDATIETGEERGDVVEGLYRDCLWVLWPGNIMTLRLGSE